MSSGRKHHHDPDKSVANGDAKLLKKRQSGGGEGCGFEGNFFMDFYFSQGDYKVRSGKKGSATPTAATTATTATTAATGAATMLQWYQQSQLYKSHHLP